jgi:cytochrome c-type biogenesis protein CcmF
VLVVLLVAGVADHPAALTMFALGAFVLATVVQEFARGIRARQAMSSDSALRAFLSLVRRNRRRYGGYIVHAGITVLLIGVAASSSFQDVTEVRLAPGETVRVGGYDIQYARPTSDLNVTSGGSLEKIDLGAQLRVRKDGKTNVLHTERSYFPSNDPGQGAVSRYFEGEATSEVGLRSSIGHDLWTVVAPDTRALMPTIRRGDAVFERASSLPEGARAAALGETLRRLVARYPRDLPPARFRVLVSPLVGWVWLGALIVFAGGLVTLWPSAAGARRAVTAASAARLARDLRRA